MSAQLKRIDDPRDALERARRPELVAFAHANGMSEINENMPAILIRRKLRDNGLTRIQVVQHALGRPEQPVVEQPIVSAPAHEVDAEADLARQFTQAKPLAKMSILELGAEMKRLGIKRARTDKMATLREKIEQHGS